MRRNVDERDLAFEVVAVEPEGAALDGRQAERRHRRPDQCRGKDLRVTPEAEGQDDAHAYKHEDSQQEEQRRGALDAGDAGRKEVSVATPATSSREEQILDERR